MKIESPRYTLMFGAVQIHEVQRVYEIDSGSKSITPDKNTETVYNIGNDIMNNIERRMAIVVLTKNESLKLLEGVISGIPHDCLIIIVSNSGRKPFDQYKNEKETINQFNKFVNRKIILIHQRDPGLYSAFNEVGYTDILQGKKVRSGKGEGVLVGLILAKIAKKDYVGFVDADNYVPGAVNEYVKNFDTGFSLASSPYSMVRISWLYKPTVTETSFYFSKWGRVNEYANKYLNRLISLRTGFGTEIIKTGNSSEYAISMSLAESLQFSSGSSVEPYSFLSVLEEMGESISIGNKDLKDKGVQIFQIETRNPYFRVYKKDEHLGNMLLSSIGSIYHSHICSDNLKKSMLNELIELGLIMKNTKLPKPPIMRPIKNLDFKKFQEYLESHADSLFSTHESMFQV